MLSGAMFASFARCSWRSVDLKIDAVCRVMRDTMVNGPAMLIDIQAFDREDRRGRLLLQQLQFPLVGQLRREHHGFARRVDAIGRQRRPNGSGGLVSVVEVGEALKR